MGFVTLELVDGQKKIHPGGAAAAMVQVGSTVVVNEEDVKLFPDSMWKVSTRSAAAPVAAKASKVPDNAPAPLKAALGEKA